MLTGRLVFEADNAFQLVVKHLKEEPVPPSRRTELHIPAALDELVLACLAKEPGRRAQSAAELAESLAAIEPDVEPWGEAQAARWWNTLATEERVGAAMGR